jgi:hypothetical protein
MATLTTKPHAAAPEITTDSTAEARIAPISAYGPARATVAVTPLSPEDLQKIDDYWRASLYLCLGMLYLQDNPLLREPLKIEHVKPRMLGHWGSDAGQVLTEGVCGKEATVREAVVPSLQELPDTPHRNCSGAVRGAHHAVITSIRGSNGFASLHDRRALLPYWGHRRVDHFPARIPESAGHRRPARCRARACVCC